MISRLALYHRWRRYQVTSITYPLLLVLLLMAATVAVAWVLTYGG